MPVAAAPRFTVAVPAWSGAVRRYAASAGLTKQEVEDRIKALLQGFDKVSLYSLSPPRDEEVRESSRSDGATVMDLIGREACCWKSVILIFAFP
jgi:hypothetical protein